MNRALLCGINAYPDAPLQGCVNDVTNMAEFLVDKCGFKRGEIRLLTDKAATTQAIKDRLKWLVDGVKAGDRIVFHYSGHGTTMATRNERGNVSKSQCSICPYDFSFSLDTAITADDFSKIFAKVPKGVIFNWFSDSCFSGNLAREIPGEYRRARTYPLTADMRWRLETAKELGLEPVDISKAVQKFGGAFVSGCGPNQTSADAFINKQYCGAFTNYLLETLNHDLSALYPKLVKDINVSLRQNNFEQEPKLHGTDINRAFLPK
jgi:uncharacterized caspase-like protein